MTKFSQFIFIKKIIKTDQKLNNPQVGVLSSSDSSSSGSDSSGSDSGSDSDSDEQSNVAPKREFSYFKIRKKHFYLRF